MRKRQSTICFSSHPFGVALAAVLGAAMVSAPSRPARADSTSVSPDGKGIVGGALLGAEVVTMTESIAGLRPGWAYAVGAIAGAGGGAAGGYFIERASYSSDGRIPTYLLAGGLALVIPAVVLVLNATRYMPDESAAEDNVPAGGPAAEPGTPTGNIITPSGGGATTSPPPSSAPTPPPPPPPAPTPPPQSLFDVHGGSFRFGVPVPDIRPVFSLAEQRQYGMQAQTELRMPIVHVAF
jgi:hypothetical protein